MNLKNIFNIRNIIILIFISATFVGGLFWQMHINGLKHEGHNVNEMTHVKAAKITYACPMHPHITSDKPGQSCPICGMDLIAVEADEKTEHSEIKLSLKKQQLIGVKIGMAEKKNLFKAVSAPGRIAFDPELYTAQSEYLEALRQKQRVKGSSLADVKQSTDEMIRSAKIRLQVLGLSDEQIKNLARKGYQSEGLLVASKDHDSWVYADVFEVDLPNIKNGLGVKITANFLQGQTLPGKVISVDQVINPDTRTAKVRIQLMKSDISIRPESYVNVSIMVPLGERLAVPIEALMDTGKDTYVFVKTSEGQFEPRPVSVLFETGDFVAIGSGLSEGDEIVISGNFLLDSESRLKSVLKDSSDTRGHNH